MMEMRSLRFAESVGAFILPKISEISQFDRQNKTQTRGKDFFVENASKNDKTRLVLTQRNPFKNFNPGGENAAQGIKIVALATECIYLWAKWYSQLDSLETNIASAYKYLSIDLKIPFPDNLTYLTDHQKLASMLFENNSFLFKYQNDQML
jgi:hypothetical protein